MGFDLYGVRAKSKKGEYFRNSIWRWPPLAEYVLDNVDIPEEERQYWDSNEGQRVSEETALLIAATLEKLLAEGKTAQYEEDYKRELDSLPSESWESHYSFSRENVKNFADFCRESGGFEIW